MFKISKKDRGSFITVLFLTLTLPLIFYLSQNTQIFNPRATGRLIPPCKLNSATWSRSSATRGTNITLNIIGTAGCAGREVKITIFKNGLFGDQAVSPPDPPVTNGIFGLSGWTAEYASDLFSYLGPNQYYFEAKIQGGPSIKSGLLDVSP